jgi:hypothetical protein
MIPGGVKLALLVAVAVALGMFYLHYTNVKAELNAAFAQVGALKVETEVQDATIQAQTNRLTDFVDAQAEFQATLNELTNAQVEANSTAKELNDVLSKHDLTRLSLAKPGLIERRINSGTAAVLSMFEHATSGRNN